MDVVPGVEEVGVREDAEGVKGEEGGGVADEVDGGVGIGRWGDGGGMGGAVMGFGDGELGGWGVGRRGRFEEGDAGGRVDWEGVFRRHGEGVDGERRSLGWWVRGSGCVLL